MWRHGRCRRLPANHRRLGHARQRRSCFDSAARVGLLPSAFNFRVIIRICFRFGSAAGSVVGESIARPMTGWLAEGIDKRSAVGGIGGDSALQVGHAAVAHLHASP